MTALEPTKVWWTTEEIAASGLPDLPATRQGVDAVAAREKWRTNPHRARRRAGRGGGWEYHWKLFPSRAQRKLLAEVAAPVSAPADARPDRDEAWTWFECLPEKVQAEARKRLLVLQKVEALVGTYVTKDMSVHSVCRMEQVSRRSIWNWFAMIEGVAPHDRLPYLAPRHRAAVRKVRRIGISPEFADHLKADYLRPASPSFTSCYRRARREAEARGWEFADERTARRILDRTVSRQVQILARKGIDALKRLYPSQTRDKTSLHAMEAVNADFHKFDVFVRWPAERGSTECYVGRPQMVAFQDIYSGRILSWRVDQTPNSEAVRMAVGDMIETYGIPEHVLLDNGREFASKALTGGAPTRFRFKVREDDLPGLFVSLGCEIHWATPYSGQSKPIERAFRDMCDSIAKHPQFDGAYTGNSPMAKPEDYGSRAVELDEFLSVLAEGIAEHNTRLGRRSEVAFERSFAEVFDESYATAQIRKATEAQRRLWLLGAEGLRGNSDTGLVRLLGNEYWAPWMHEVAGERVIARFDPADLWSGLHIYSAENIYLGHAPCKLKAGFFDVGEARAHSKARKSWMNAQRAELEAHRRVEAVELGATLPLEPADPVEAKVVRPIFGKPAKGQAEGVMAADVAEAQAAIVADLAAHRPQPVAEEPTRERFRRALGLERDLEGGAILTVEQVRWLKEYQTTPEYRAERMLWEDFGDAIFG